MITSLTVNMTARVCNCSRRSHTLRVNNTNGDSVKVVCNSCGNYTSTSWTGVPWDINYNDNIETRNAQLDTRVSNVNSREDDLNRSEKRY